MFRGKTKSIDILAITGIFLIICSTLIFNLGAISKPQMTDSSNSNSLNLQDSSSTVIMKNNPFTNHTQEDLTIYSDSELKYLYEYNGGASKTALFHHSHNNTQAFTLIDDNFYSIDQFYYLMGLGDILYPSLSKLLKWTALKETPLWDKDSGDGGFYYGLYDNLTRISTEKRAFDNLLPLLTLQDAFIKAGYDDSLKTNISAQWQTSTNLFWNDTNKGFMHSTESDPTIEYTTDNMLAAYIAFKLTNNPQLEYIRSDTSTKAIEIMDSFNYTGAMYDAAEPSYFSYYSTTTKSKTGISHKYLLPNALAILALTEWNIAEGYDESSEKLDIAQKIWRFLNSSLFNSTYNMYMTAVKDGSSEIADYNLNLLDNAWMLYATLELFKSTGNQTYYDEAFKLYYGIEDSLYISSDKGYNSTIGPDGADIKTTDSYNMMVGAMLNFLDIYNHTTITTFTNQSEYRYLESSTINVTVNMNLTMVFENFSNTLSKWDVAIPISNAPIEFTLRYITNFTILDEKTITTDNSGNVTYTFSIPETIEIQSLKLSLMANKSNYVATSYDSVTINYRSGLSITSTNADFDYLYQDQSGTINLTIASLRDTKIAVKVKNYGDEFLETVSSSSSIIDNLTDTFVLIDVHAKSNAQLGIKQLQIELYNGSIKLAAHTIDIEIKSVLDFEYCVFDPKIIDFQPINLTFFVFNHNTQGTENFDVELIGNGIFESRTTNVSSVNPNSIANGTILINTTNNAKYGDYTFGLNFSRNGNGFKYVEYSISIVPRISIKGINAQTSVLHGITPKIVLNVQNNGYSSETLKVKISSGLMSRTQEITVISGEQSIELALDVAPWNPYDLSEKSYIITVFDSNNKQIYSDKVDLTQQLSISSLLFGYIIPVIIPISIILYYKNKEIEFNRRNL